MRKRGYETTVGLADPFEASLRSNAWGADVHIQMHSNSVSTNPPGQCLGNNPFSSFTPGTRVAWRSGVGKSIADKLRGQVGNESPGSNDVSVCVRPSPIPCPCPNGFAPCSLIELNSTNAPAAYLETEFHQWNQGADFLKNPYGYTFRIAEAIDQHFSYPR